MATGSISQAIKLIASGTSVKPSYTYYFASAFPAYAAGHSVQYGTTPGGSYTLSAADFVNLTSLSESVSATALTAIARVSAVSFNYLNSVSADIVISGVNKTLYTASGGEVAAFAYLPRGTDPIRSDLWIMQGGSAPSFLPTVVQHELLHSVGLADVTSPTATLYSGIENSQQYTIMSYVLHPGENRLVTELQLYDIAALQAVYGRDESYNSGDTTISNFVEATGPSAGHDRAFSVWDAGGTDTIDAAGIGQAALIDLRPGHFSSIGPNSSVQIVSGATPAVTNAGTSNISIAFGAYIENAKGTAAGDLLIGNILSNRLDGGAGDDVIYAEGKDSLYDPGDGDYRRVVETGTHTEDAPSSIQALVDNPNLQRDVLIGGAGSDYLRGAGATTRSGATRRIPTNRRPAMSIP